MTPLQFGTASEFIRWAEETLSGGGSQYAEIVDSASEERDMGEGPVLAVIRAAESAGKVAVQFAYGNEFPIEAFSDLTEATAAIQRYWEDVAWDSGYRIQIGKEKEIVLA
jgi:hypothetical protein